MTAVAGPRAAGSAADGSAVSAPSGEVCVDFDNSYARLPPCFFARLDPTPVAQPALIKFNAGLAAELGLRLAAADANCLAAFFSGNRLLAGSQPLAMAYAGHQFGGFVPQLGDGRALLLGEVIDRHGARRDIQLKGSGPTPFSRGGDGRAALGPVLREYIVSEAMHALGVPATRALAVVTTGEAVFRERKLPGGIVTRVAASHIRVGTFQYFAARGDTVSTRRLADMVIDRHYPELRDAEHRYLALLRAVTLRQAALIAAWMGIGFIHGVMNTDNMTVSGETIDFGPCAFMDAYDPDTVFSSIDRTGRYAYSNQPAAAQWNLARFAETLLPLIDADANNAVAAAGEAVSLFAGAFEANRLATLRGKLGLATAQPDDAGLAQELLAAMHRHAADFTLSWRRLCDLAADATPGTAAVAPASPDAWPAPLPGAGRSLPDPFTATPQGIAWTARWRLRCAAEIRDPAERAAAMKRVNPAVIPRNHRIEEAIVAAVERGDLEPFEKLLKVLSTPFRLDPAHAAYEQPPQAHERVLATFCGT